MKKILTFLFLLIMPFVVKAAEEVEITNIKLLEKTESVEILSEPTFKGLNVDFNIKFSEVGDNAKYEITITNNSKEDYELENTTKFSDNEYIKYDIKYDNDSNVLKAGKESKATIVITYDKEIPVEAFNDEGSYIEENKYTLDLSNGEKNPYTSTLPYIVALLAVISLILVIIAFKKKKALMVLLIGISIMSIPLITNALRRLSFNISTKIVVDDRPYILDTDRGSFSNTEDIKQLEVKFDNNQYKFERQTINAQWYAKQYGVDLLVFNVMKKHFTKDSFVRLYDVETNELLYEITYDSFPRPLYHVTHAFLLENNRLEITIPGYDKENVRIEVSEDLQEAYDENEAEVAILMYTGNVGKIDYYAPWISDTESINKIQILNNSVVGYHIDGFVRDRKDSHLYHAIWVETVTQYIE